ncbi:MAG: cyclopropane-fatty-acyl-phospholipid synthase family protein [Aestuariivirga sp.]|nr:cyclopropane-fatty-acyl-phospholipid synthase family protein [Aestuariivirga sp.]
MLSKLIRKTISRGRLHVIFPGGRRESFGLEGGVEAAIRISDTATMMRIVACPSVGFGEGYMEGRIEVCEGSIRDVIDILTSNMEALEATPLFRLRNFIGRRRRSLRQFNTPRRAQRNVAHHYDLSESLYRLFLDEDMQYSCAYFASPHDDLETAQRRKKWHIASKLLLEPGQSVLDIGSGWGGLAIELACLAGADVTGVTLSREQLRAASERVHKLGLAARVKFDLADYRQLSGPFDRVVSVGMFEHVGVPNYRDFFRQIKKLLRSDGIALIHAIGRKGPPGCCDSWIEKHIFPGGYIPALSEVLSAVEHEGLWVTDVEILRLHYAETLKHWFDRFQANRRAAAVLYDERFCRMWEFYLASCEMAFRNGDLMVFQLQLSPDRMAVPIIRDYMVDGERSLASQPRSLGWMEAAE